MNKYLLLTLLASYTLLSHAQTTIIYVDSDWKELKKKLRQIESTTENLDPRPLKEQQLTLEEEIKLLETLGQTKRAATLKKQLAVINARKAEAETKHQQEEKKKLEAETKRQQKEKSEIITTQEKKDNSVLPDSTPTKPEADNNNNPVSPN